jgi:hypothetical protein
MLWARASAAHPVAAGEILLVVFESKAALEIRLESSCAAPVVVAAPPSYPLTVPIAQHIRAATALLQIERSRGCRSNPDAQ